jgi:hypothetical protein
METSFLKEFVFVCWPVMLSSLFLSHCRTQWAGGCEYLPLRPHLSAPGQVALSSCGEELKGAGRIKVTEEKKKADCSLSQC